jgi:hypothetical protein
MSQMTITEALAEVKLIDAKVAKKHEFAKQYLLRQEAFKDPLASSGGSRQAVDAERQSVNDLLERKVKIRRAIAEANIRTEVTVAGETRSIADWLVWRREVAPKMNEHLAELSRTIQRARQEAAQKGAQVVAAGQEPAKPTDVVVNIDEKKLAAQTERLSDALTYLDGQLSLKNATVLVEV